MQKQEDILKEDPFLGDANWSLVWRYGCVRYRLSIVTSVLRD